jgi:hypothetical protein
VLDLEGNNCKNIDEFNYFQLFCKDLRSLCLKDNPLSKEITYYKKVEESCPLLESLDEEPIP